MAGRRCNGGNGNGMAERIGDAFLVPVCNYVGKWNPFFPVHKLYQ